MAVSSGFFNSRAGEHDRMYNADQLSSIFDGIISDGIYADYGERFVVSHRGGLDITVGTGRAWFNHTWTVNDSLIGFTLTPGTITMDRIDAVVIEVNKSEDIRANDIKIVKGQGSPTDPQRPELQHDGYINQYALAYIYVKKGAESITEADITMVIGTDETPFIKNVLENISIDDLLKQYQAQADLLMEDERKSFDDWFKNVQDTLDGDTAGKLQHQIDDLWAFLNSIPNGEEIAY